MKGFNCLNQVVCRLQAVLSNQSIYEMQCVLLTYCKSIDDLRLYFFGDVGSVKTFDDDELVLLCYYAPMGDWQRCYGDDWISSLSKKRIARDILNNTVLYKRYLGLNGMEVLPKWLRVEVKRWL